MPAKVGGTPNAALFWKAVNSCPAMAIYAEPAIAKRDRHEIPRRSQGLYTVRRRRQRLRRRSAARNSSSSAARTAATAAKAATSIVEAVNGLNTLIDYRFQQHFKAQRGDNGMGKDRHGANGKDIVLRVPVGTAGL